MKAFLKTLVGDTWNIAGVALIVMIAVGLTAVGKAELATVAMPAAGLCVVGWLARR